MLWLRLAGNRPDAYVEVIRAQVSDGATSCQSLSIHVRTHIQGGTPGPWPKTFLDVGACTTCPRRCPGTASLSRPGFRLRCPLALIIAGGCTS